jgi:dipeptidyl aminopeptidase/acylaminoacyl peptidase
VAVLCCISLPAIAAAPVPISAFFDRAAYGAAVLSPDGTFLATRVPDQRGHDALVVIELTTLHPTIAAGYTDDDIGSFRWVNNQRLVYTLHDKQQARGDIRLGPGLYAVNRDGTRQVQLAVRTPVRAPDGSLMSKKLLPWNINLMNDTGAQNTDAIYVRSPEYDNHGYGNNLAFVNLIRLDTVTGRSEVVSRPGNVEQWWLDWYGEPRLARTREGKTGTLFYRDPATAAWRAIATFDAYIDAPDDFDPIGFGPDGTLYVSTAAGSPTTGLHRFNFSTNRADPDALVAAPGYDFYGRFIINQSKILGVRMATDAYTTVWFDPAMKALQSRVDTALPGLINLIQPAADPAATNVLVTSYSDQSPLRYALFNAATGQLNPIGNSRAAIDPASMGRQEMVSYKARDGLPIPALLTLPPGGKLKHLPMVVMVHDGPWQDGPRWAWNAESQFLASRGYAVLEPHYRGSTGLGYRHLSAGFRQWGLAMQDDIADGTRWAIAQGYADASRVCIAGASYGGYAALMGLVNDPALYKCGIDWVGVTDINLMYTDTWFSTSDIGDDYKKYGMPRLIGDRVTDAAQLKATSPIEQASRITQPLLLAYGGADNYVPMAQGRLFYDKVSQTNADVEWIGYGNEGHGWYLPANSIDFWTRVEKFLDRNIGVGK